MNALEEAARAQNAASSPDLSTWVSANAGSGKTRVLTDRVARLLLAGSNPENILCLTFTKAAAAEMQSRLFRRLGGWAMLGDDALRNELRAIGEDTDDPKRLAEARRLFARALETPGGLKIQTIHAFCGALLRRFPLEAGVSPQFREMDDRDAMLLRSEVLETLAVDAPAAFAAFAVGLTDDTSLDGLLQSMVKAGDVFMNSTPADLARVLDVDPKETEEQIYDAAMDGVWKASIQLVAEAIAAQGTENAQKSYAEPLLLAIKQAAPHLAGPDLEKVFLKADGDPRKISNSFPTRKIADDPRIENAILTIQDCITEALNKKRLSRSYHRSCALLEIGKEFHTRYARAKQERGVLDFDDLIDRSSALLTRADMADWVLYRMDGQLDHILVDEAQDTSPRQWAVVKALAGEFISGPGARNSVRTVFVVGDRKQSIFGFQGADPKEFFDTEAFFRDRLTNAPKPLQSVGLQVSFRSAKPILDLVDTVFADDQSGALGGADRHVSFADRPGKIEVWPFQFPESENVEGNWWDPVDEMAVDHPVLLLADKVADRIDTMLATGVEIPHRKGDQTEWHPVTAGDIMVLLRVRNAFFYAVIAALKARGVPVAGADRIKLAEEIGVQDVLSLLAFLDLEQDDLSLAEALRSPLFGLSEEDLFQLAQPRQGTLWQTLRTSRHETVVAQIAEMKKRIDFDRPYELIERMLLTLGGRERMVARLGPECEDGLDELLRQALTYERTNTPSLTGFLRWIGATETDVKRDMDAASNEVRVMTVHGAKGLEAPVVFVPDVSENKDRTPPILSNGEVAFWSPRTKEMPPVLRELLDAHSAADARERERLFYVAMTRAESWLILCGAGKSQPGEDRWHTKASAAVEAMGEDALEHLWETRTGPVAAPPLEGSQAALPDWLSRPMPKPPEKQEVLTPSKQDGSHALAGEYDEGHDTERAMERGRLIHALLDSLPQLPPDRQGAAAARCLGDDPDADALLAEAMALINDPELAAIFATDTLAEVSVSAALPDGRRIRGQIDRLIIRSDIVEIVDFKSNRIVPSGSDDVPTALLAQMATYRAALGRVYPDRTIAASILWTRSRNWMKIPPNLLTDAWESISAP